MILVWSLLTASTSVSFNPTFFHLDCQTNVCKFVMAEHSKLAFVVYYEHLPTKKQHVRGYVTDLPKTFPDNITIKFRPLSEVQFAKDFELEIEKPTCAVFDHQTDEIIWANVGKTGYIDPYPWSHPVNIWRFDKYCQINGQEKSPSPSGSYTEPSVIIKDNIVSCSAVSLKSEKDNINKWYTIPSQKAADDKEWKTVPFNSPTSTDLPFKTGSDPGLPQSTLFTSSDTDIQYVYNVRVLDDIEKNVILLDVMKASRFNNLRKDSSPVWQSFEIQMNFKVYDQTESRERNWEGVKMALTRDEVNKKWRLYFIKKPRAESNIYMAYVPLRSDGSVDSFQNKITAQGQISFYTAAGYDLKVFVFDKKILVLGKSGWDTYGSIAEISSDGSLPKDEGLSGYSHSIPVWRRVKCEFENFIEHNHGTDSGYWNYYTAGCTVPDSFGQ